MSDDQNVLETLNLILNKLETLEQRIERIEKISDNMDRHIGFVENMYDYIKTPFHAMIDYNKYMLPSSSTDQKNKELTT